MKTLNEFLLEREIKANKIEYSKEKTKELLDLIGVYGTNKFSHEDAIALLNSGAEVTGLLIQNLIGCLINENNISIEASKVLLYIKDTIDISKLLMSIDSLGWTLPQEILGGEDIPLIYLKWLTDNGFINKSNINLKNKFNNTLLGFIVNFTTRSSNDIKKAIDILLDVGVDINDTSFKLKDITKKVIQEYLIQKGRTQA